MGIGDDAAILAAPSDMELAVAMDTLNSGVHFPADAKPTDIGYKAMAVNLSDMAAMGARPLWALLSLSLPDAEEDLVAGIAEGIQELTQGYQFSLVGGDTTRGPLSLTVCMHGLLPRGKALRRDGARAGDLICVSGTLGDAGAGLALHQGAGEVNMDSFLLQRLHRPTPRIELGQALLDHAHAAIDISDGLLADLTHILTASRCGARVDCDSLPLSPALLEAAGPQQALDYALHAGDDYELCFTLPAASLDSIRLQAQKLGVAITVIGEVLPQPGLELHQAGQVVTSKVRGYEHFKSH